MPEVDPENPFPFPFPREPFPWPRWPEPPFPRLPEPFPWPPIKIEPNFPQAKDGGEHSGPPLGYREVPGTAQYSATRLGEAVFVRARGMLGSSSQIADLQVDSRLIHPVQLRFVVYTPKFGGVTLTRNFDFTAFPRTHRSSSSTTPTGRKKSPLKMRSCR